MHHRLGKVVIVAALAFGALSGSASAVTWSTNGVVNFTATTGATKFTDSASSATLSCSGTTTANRMIGTEAALAGAPGGRGIAAVEPQFSDCTIAGVRFAISCVPLGSAAPAPASFDGSFWTAAGMAPLWQNATTDGAITAVDCDFNIPNCLTTLTGTMDFRYFNPGMITRGLFKALTSQNLAISNNNSATCTALRLRHRDAMRFTDVLNNPVQYDVTVPAALTSQPIVSQP